MPKDTKILSQLAVDDALVQDANYDFDASDRQYIDKQIRGVQQLLVDGLIKGRLGSWFDLDATSVAVSAGDVVCLAASTSGTVTKATTSALTAAVSPLGVVVYASAPGSKVFVAVGGSLPPAITGLSTGTAGYVRVNTSTARLQRVTTLSPTDYVMGSGDATGWMIMARAIPLTSSGATLVGDGTTANYSVISGSAGIKYTGNPNTKEYDLPIAVITATTSATSIFSFATTTARAYSVRGIIRVQNSPVSAYGEFEISAFAYNNVGTLTVVGAAPVTTKVNQAGFALTFTASGTNLVVTATDPVGGRRWTGRLYLVESNF